MNLSYYDIRLQMCKIAKCMWDRRLTNAAGGNFAVRVEENRILISPSMMSEHHQCDLQPEDLLLIDYDENVLEGTGKLSRETKMHILLLSGFKNIGATIHAHPFYCMPFIAFSQPIPNVTEATMGARVRGMHAPGPRPTPKSWRTMCMTTSTSAANWRNANTGHDHAQARRVRQRPLAVRRLFHARAHRGRRLLQSCESRHVAGSAVSQKRLTERIHEIRRI